MVDILMDRNFFEFWGRMFLGVAEGQKRTEDMEQLFRQGLKGYESVLALFREVYKLNPPAASATNDRELWEKTLGNFQSSFRQIMTLWGMVPKEDYESLRDKCETLERKIVEQEQMIGHLKMLLGERQDNAVATTQELQTLLTAQQEEFQTLMNAMGAFFQESKKAPPAKKK